MIDDLIGKIPGLCQVSFLTSSLPEVSTALSRGRYRVLEIPTALSRGEYKAVEVPAALSRGEYGVLEVSSALSRVIPALNLYRKR